MSVREVLYTIGHGSRTAEGFVTLLREAGIGCLIDVRAEPASHRYPHFRRNALERILAAERICYVWEGRALGGRRLPTEQSSHTALSDEGFRAYADHMMTEEFQTALQRVIMLGCSSRAAIMCAERLPQRCHRILIADCLVTRDCDVRHLIDSGDCQMHRLSSLANVSNGQLIYDRSDQLHLEL